MKIIRNIPNGAKLFRSVSILTIILAKLMSFVRQEKRKRRGLCSQRPQDSGSIR